MEVTPSPPAAAMIEQAETLGEIPLHPLLIPPVLDNLFGFLSVADLCTLRLVNKTWNSCAIPHLKQRSPPIPLNRNELSSQELVNQEIDKLTTCAGRSANFPFGKVELGRISDSFPGNTWNQLLVSGAPWLTGLKLWGSFRNRGQPDVFTPQLRTLEVITNGPNAEHCRVFVDVVERNARNLVTLVVTDSNTSAVLLRQLSQVEGLSLTEFSLHYSYNSGNEADYCGALLQFLASQRHSLRKLRLEIKWSRNFNLAFHLPQLESLSLSWEEGEALFDTPVQWAHAFPKLLFLRLHNRPGWTRDSAGNWKLLLGEQKTAAGSVTHLTLTGLYDRRLIAKARQVFPNLAKLETRRGN